MLRIEFCHVELLALAGALLHDYLDEAAHVAVFTPLAHELGLRHVLHFLNM